MTLPARLDLPKIGTHEFRSLTLTEEQKQGWDLACMFIERWGDQVVDKHVSLSPDTPTGTDRTLAIHGGHTAASMARVLRMAV